MRIWFEATVLVLLITIAAGVLLHAENGRYQLVKTEQNEILLDTRTGEYWVDAALHVDPRHGKVETKRAAVTEPQP